MTGDNTAIRSFDHIWNKAIQPVIADIERGCDPEFRQCCSLRSRDQEEWKAAIYQVYLISRKQLKDICYGPSDNRSAEELLDSRKIAAVLCSALIKEKGFSLDLEQANQYIAKKKTELSNPIEFNKWAAQNVYINYMMAYCTSVQLVYLTLMRELLLTAGLKDEDTNRKLPYDGHRQWWENEGIDKETATQMSVLLNRQKRLSSYPALPKADSFPVNVILGLARMDTSASDLDMFMFAMMLCQLEEYTIIDLKRKLLEINAKNPR